MVLHRGCDSTCATYVHRVGGLSGFSIISIKEVEVCSAKVTCPGGQLHVHLDRALVHDDANAHAGDREGAC